MLDPQAQRLLDEVAKAGRPPIYTLSAPDARRVFKETRMALQPPPPDVALVENRTINGPHGPIPLRLYRPVRAQPSDVSPALVYFHGGGFTIGDLDTHDVLCRSLANAAKCAVISVDYRMGPENKFPKAVHDSIAAARWVAQDAAKLGIDPKRLAVGGDSAGGNLATVVALSSRDADGPRFVFQLLIYPTTTLNHDTPSTQELARGYLLTIDSMYYFRESYLRTEQDRADWRASPLLAPTLAGLPPTLLITAGYDPIRDEGKAYAEKLKAAGVDVTYHCYDGMIHGFITMGKVLDDANRAVQEAGEALARAFAR